MCPDKVGAEVRRIKSALMKSDIETLVTVVCWVKACRQLPGIIGFESVCFVRVEFVGGYCLALRGGVGV